MKAGDILVLVLVVAGGAVLAAIVERSAVFQSIVQPGSALFHGL